MRRLTVGAAALAVCPVAAVRTAQRSHPDLAGQDGWLTIVTAGSNAPVDRLPADTLPADTLLLDRSVADDPVIGNLRWPYAATLHHELVLTRRFAYVTAQSVGAKIERNDPSGGDSQRGNRRFDVLSFASTIAWLDDNLERHDGRIGTVFE